MEILFNKFVKSIVTILDKNSKCNEIEQLQMCYGLQTLIYNIVVTALILTAAFFVGTLKETFLLFIFFGTLRFLTGGYHFNSILKCLTATTLIMVGGGKLAHTVQINLLLCLLICICLNIVFFNFVPIGTHKNPYSIEYSHLQQKRLKKLSCLLTLIAIFSPPIPRTIIILSMVITAMSLIPELNRKFQAAV